MHFSIGYCRVLLTRDFHTIPSALDEPVHTVSLKHSKRCIQPIERDLNIKIYTQTLTISKEILTFLHTCRSLYIYNHQDSTPLILHRDGFQTYSNDVPLYKKQTLMAMTCFCLKIIATFITAFFRSFLDNMFSRRFVHPIFYKYSFCIFILS